MTTPIIKRSYCFIELATNDDADNMFCMRYIEIKGKVAEFKKGQNGRLVGKRHGASGGATGHSAAAARHSATAADRPALGHRAHQRGRAYMVQ